MEAKVTIHVQVGQFKGTGGQTTDVFAAHQFNTHVVQYFHALAKQASAFIFDYFGLQFGELERGLGIFGTQGEKAERQARDHEKLQHTSEHGCEVTDLPADGEGPKE